VKAAQTVQHLKAKLGDAILKETECCGAWTLEIDKAHLIEVLSLLKQTPQPGYEVLMDLTGVDYLEPIKGTRVIYWLHHPINLERLRIAVFVKRNETLPSVVSLWEGADWFECEVYDLFGVGFEGHRDLKRILMPDDWMGHPLRKDYALTEESVEFKHGVKPKVPSEIIPYVRDVEKS
jgi:NADH-quinone oxidoreductase subunit C